MNRASSQAGSLVDNNHLNQTAYNMNVIEMDMDHVSGLQSNLNHNRRHTLGVESQQMTKLHRKNMIIGNSGNMFERRKGINSRSSRVSPQPYKNQDGIYKSKPDLKFSLANSDRYAKKKTYDMLKNLPKTETEFKASIDKLSVYLTNDSNIFNNDKSNYILSFNSIIENPTVKTISPSNMQMNGHLTINQFINSETKMKQQLLNIKKSQSPTIKIRDNHFIQESTNKTSTRKTSSALDPVSNNKDLNIRTSNLQSPSISIEKEARKKPSITNRNVHHTDNTQNQTDMRYTEDKGNTNTQMNKNKEEHKVHDGNSKNMRTRKESIKVSPIQFDKLEKVPNSHKEFAIKHHLFQPINHILNKNKAESVVDTNVQTDVHFKSNHMKEYGSNIFSNVRKPQHITHTNTNSKTGSRKSIRVNHRRGSATDNNNI